MDLETPSERKRRLGRERQRRWVERHPRLAQERQAAARQLETEEQRAERKKEHCLRVAAARQVETDVQRYERRIKQSLRAAAVRAAESEQQKNERRIKQALRAAAVRAAESDAQRSERNRMNALYAAAVRAGESDEQKNERNRMNALYAAAVRAAESDEQKNERNRMNALYAAAVRAAESDEQTNERNQLKASYTAAIRAAESDEQINERNRLNALYAAAARVTELDEQINEKNRMAALRTAAARAAESDEQRNERRRIDALRAAAARAAESDEQRNERKRMNALRTAAARAAESEEAKHIRRKLDAARKLRKKAEQIEKTKTTEEVMRTAMEKENGEVMETAMEKEPEGVRETEKEKEPEGIREPEGVREPERVRENEKEKDTKMCHDSARKSVSNLSTCSSMASSTDEDVINKSATGGVTHIQNTTRHKTSFYSAQSKIDVDILNGDIDKCKIGRHIPYCNEMWKLVSKTVACNNQHKTWTERLEKLTDCSVEKIITTFFHQTLSFLETKVAIACMRLFLKRWEGWRQIFTLDIQKAYVVLFRYLKVNWDCVEPLIQEHMGKLVTENDPDAEVFHIECPMSVLKCMFTGKPGVNGIFNWTAKTPVQMSLTTRDLLNWPGITIRLNLPCFQFVHTNYNSDDYTILDIDSRDQLNDSLCTDPMNLDLHYKTYESGNSYNPRFVVQYMQQLKAVLRSEQNPLVRVIEPILEESIKDVSLLECDISTGTEYYKHLSPYSYTRFFGDFKDDRRTNSILKFKPRLRQTTYPAVKFELGKFSSYFDVVGDNKVKFFFDRTMFSDISLSNCLLFVCNICNFTFGSHYCLQNLISHLDDDHGEEIDWKCSKCGKAFSTAELSRERWSHVC